MFVLDVLFVEVFIQEEILKGILGKWPSQTFLIAAIVWGVLAGLMRMEKKPGAIAQQDGERLDGSF
jgi:hypothetical protein